MSEQETEDVERVVSVIGEREWVYDRAEANDEQSNTEKAACNKRTRQYLLALEYEIALEREHCCEHRKYRTYRLEQVWISQGYREKGYVRPKVK